MSSFNNLNLSKGSPTPLGISKQPKGINFAFYSESREVKLCLFSKNNEVELLLDNKTNNIFHVLIENIPPDTVYHYKINDQNICDPYAKFFNSPNKWGEKPKDDTYLKAKLEFEKSFNWENIKKPKIQDNLVIYEMHTRGFTIDRSSKVKYPGSFLGIIEKIDYLKSLKVNAIELMPIYEFDECAYNFKNPKTHKQLYNYWGYAPVSFFSVMKRYGSLEDLKKLVKELHKNNMILILDVVYNHMQYPIKDKNYFMLDKDDNYLNFSGCGNTVNCNTKICSDLILQSLIYFAEEVQIDGFRFDLASILTRDEKGRPLKKPLILEKIKKEPKLKNAKFIAEPWDALGLYRLGYFQKYNFFEWNDKFRDNIKRFIRGDFLEEKNFLDSFSGSKSIFKNINNSINYITCHDGFTLNDLVSYRTKHNLENAENNQDGSDINISTNYGIEGQTTDKNIRALRNRQIKNYLMALIFAKGTPMLLMGDEYLHTKLGNNNSWCQDTQTNWFVWDKKNEIFLFIQKLLDIKKTNNFNKKKIKTSYKKNICSIFYGDFFICFNSNDINEKIILAKGNWQVIIDTSKKDSNKKVKNEYEMNRFSSILLKRG